MTNERRHAWKPCDDAKSTMYQVLASVARYSTSASTVVEAVHTSIKCACHTQTFLIVHRRSVPTKNACH